MSSPAAWALVTPLTERVTVRVWAFVSWKLSILVITGSTFVLRPSRIERAPTDPAADRELSVRVACPEAGSAPPRAPHRPRGGRGPVGGGAAPRAGPAAPTPPRLRPRGRADDPEAEGEEREGGVR